MAEGGEGGGHETTALSDVVDSVVDSVVEKVKELPAVHKSQNDGAETVSSSPSRSSYRLFGRERSVHELLGGNKMANVMLWRDKKLSCAILAAASLVYALFELLGFHVLHFLSISLLIVIATLFVWANGAALLNRSPPPIPRMHISENTSIHFATIIKDKTNKIVDMLQDVVLGKDVKLFLKLEVALWAVALIGQWFDFLSLLYLGLLLSLSVPLVYDKYDDKIDHALQKGYQQSMKLHKKLRDQVWSKIPHLHSTDKKIQ